MPDPRKLVRPSPHLDRGRPAVKLLSEFSQIWSPDDLDQGVGVCLILRLHQEKRGTVTTSGMVSDFGRLEGLRIWESSAFDLESRAGVSLLFQLNCAIPNFELECADDGCYTLTNHSPLLYSFLI